MAHRCAREGAPSRSDRLQPGRVRLARRQLGIVLSIRNGALGAVALLAGILLQSLPANAQDLPNAGQHYSIESPLRRPDGSEVLLRIELLAPSADEARDLARAFTQALVPGSTVMDGVSSVSAAWLPWSWRWSPSELPVPVAYNPTGAPAAVGPSAIIAGLQVWSSVPNSAFRYQYAGVTERTASVLDFGPDGENVISWGSLPCDRGCVLGVTSKESAHEVDMLLNNNPAAAEQLGVGDRLDWRTVILHELGHMAGLEHSCPAPFGPCTKAESDAVMYFQYRGLLRKLAPDDEAGVAALYPQAPTPANPTPVPQPPGLTPTPTPAPELPVVLERGWNLVLLPPGTPQAAASGLGCIAAIYTLESGEWRAWIQGIAPVLQGITQLEANRSYWVKADSACAQVFPVD